jgi:hypothetical protein
LNPVVICARAALGGRSVQAGLFVDCVYGYRYPLTRHLARGLRLLRSGDATPNFLAVWVAIALIVFNLDRFSDRPLLNL